MVVLQLVDQVVPIEHMRTPLSLTVRRGWREGEGGRERGMEGDKEGERLWENKRIAKEISGVVTKEEKIK